MGIFFLSTISLVAIIYYSSIYVPETLIYNYWMANSALKDGEYWDASKYLEFTVYNETDSKKKEDNYHKAMIVFNTIDSDYSAKIMSHHMIDNGFFIPRSFYFLGVHYWENENFNQAKNYLSKVSHIYQDAYSQLLEDIREKQHLEETEQIKQIAGLFLPTSPLDFVPCAKLFKSAKKLRKLSKARRAARLSSKSMARLTVKGKQKITAIKNKSSAVLDGYRKCIKNNTNKTICENMLKMDVTL